jgi:HSP20 family protein
VIIMNRTNPFDEIEQFLGRTSFGGDRAWGRDLRTTDIDVAEYDDEFVVMADLPGYDREDIDVRATEGRLTISAERGAERETAESENADRRYLRRERRHQSITRSVDLPGPVVEEDASATYRHGVLTVTLPKAAAEADDGHRIDVA